jgi:GTA TIM-barrel-like domain/Putative phage tail protein
MASIILSAAGAAIGSTIPVIGPFIGASIGQTLGAQLGSVIDDAIFGKDTVRVEGPRLEDLAVQASTYGKNIPIIYGNMRLAGNIIWADAIKETSSTSNRNNGTSRVSTTNYHYSVSLAIALCEGEITAIERMWADAQPINSAEYSYRIYYGTEDQLPDTLIEAIEGQGNTPAYRGLAYVVFEDFPLALYGNRIPNFTFEVQRATPSDDYNGLATEDMVRAMTIIPGAGEFVYDTTEQFKVQGEYTGFGFAKKAFKRTINHHAADATTNAISSLNQLQSTCTQLEWVSVVVTWFGDSLDAGLCTIYPAVEYQDDAITEPDAWSVAGQGRQSARVITYDNNTPRYGGTPSDASVLRYVAELKQRGYKVMLYPMFFMDVENKPWRGRVTGSASQVADFFTKPQGLNRMILHYATLMQGKVDALVIGSELIGLTKVQDGAGNFPAVNALVALAAQVKNVMGSSTKITYAADWSEYHHTEGGWYNLDPLWASANIDMIGIDAYFPLTEGAQRERGYSPQDVIDGWDSGEGYDYVYNHDRTQQLPISPAYAWKNIEWFWRNLHINPNGTQTGWIAESKPIWFTEYGFPSVDAATNQPNVFYDPTSLESFFPRGSEGNVDIVAQRQGITGTCARWNDSDMVQQLFLWTWDARPYPFFPDLRRVWADGHVWQTGHWVTGKFGTSSLAAIIRDLCIRSGVNAAAIDVGRIVQQVEGFIIAQTGKASKSLGMLLDTYLIDVIELDGKLVFLPQDLNGQPVRLEVTQCVRRADNPSEDVLKITHIQESALPKSVALNVLDKTRDYQNSLERATRYTSESRQEIIRYLPLVMGSTYAYLLAEAQLSAIWHARTRYQFTLNNEYAWLHAGAHIIMDTTQHEHHMRITAIRRYDGQLLIDAVGRAAHAAYLPRYTSTQEISFIQAVSVLPSTELIMLDIPALSNDPADAAMLKLAGVPDAENWQGAIVYYEQSPNEYASIASLSAPATYGIVVNTVPTFLKGNVTDETHYIDVIIRGDAALYSVTHEAILRSSNLALVGDELVQFRQATLIRSGRYRLSGLLRARYGTEAYMATHHAGERFILLDGAVVSVTMAEQNFYASRSYKAVTVGATLASAAVTQHSFKARSLKPYAPAHLKAIMQGSDIQVSWVRRDRIYGQWLDFVDVGMAEGNEYYRIDVWINGVQKRTAYSEVATFSYDTAMQHADGYDAELSCVFSVAQMSERVGAGTPSSLVF